MPAQRLSLRTTHATGFSQKASAFTLVEIMVVVVIIGMLAAIAIPSWKIVRVKSQNAIIINDLRQFATAFQNYELQYGEWPKDQSRGVVPPEIDGYLAVKAFAETPPVGGSWDWESKAFGITAGISLKDARVDDARMTDIDEIIDDGDLSTGSFRVVTGDGYTLILAE